MQFDWYGLFDELKRRGHFSSDAQLADSLMLTRAQISAWRTGKSDLGTLTKIKILDALGHDTLRSAVLSLLPEKNRQEQIAHHARLIARVERNGQVPEPASADANVMPPDTDALPTTNHLLAALPRDERERIAPHLSTVAMPLGQVVYESGDHLSHVYLPITAIISMLYVMENGASAEIAVVGKDGLLGVALFMGGETMPNRAIVQSAGHAFRLSGPVVKDEFARGGALQRIFLRYTQALITQMAQTAVCNRHHSISQQFCRWLLLSLDRLESNEVRMTQELIANMLGVRRAGVTETARKLQDEGIIRYTRGLIEVLDRGALEAQVCECYRVVKRESDRLLGD
ncbi:Crp/Fnr family transcriptional regulator [Paraburkholderia caballeronis]|uniref:cAMP-binding domain of CRP or a regulatory subunit of cAMP-dependent protein kinases n=1 Tax=Paraburkholderia caballeronis TaxID=416943 RepID=A0A1H7LVL0_9BURK|nr:CRP-like cAMP-binding protein [Paraburkholderia caballeronis]PXX03966.1 CRP-like cAMP-binding protein [Paraburkholderia caballeronis]RAK04710.1 CRP-like cAMP-binding protein [Paraburkholderia caballeronis]TDV19612.1 CRP-like cAMP-binding protein [Paraburkholderia caballeronis]TDV22211.1 CRP-like cAMP-binding protein [Paraburkholderia caballeronis]